MNYDYNRYRTIEDIRFYLKNPIFKNKYYSYYDSEIGDLLITAINVRNNGLDFFDTTFKQSILPDDVKSIFQIPNERVMIIEGDSIEKFADSLLELLLVLKTKNKA